MAFPANVTAIKRVDPEFFVDYLLTEGLKVSSALTGPKTPNPERRLTDGFAAFVVDGGKTCLGNRPTAVTDEVTTN